MRLTTAASQRFCVLPLLLIFGGLGGCQILRKWDPSTESWNDFLHRYSQEVRDPAGNSQNRPVRITKDAPSSNSSNPGTSRTSPERREPRATGDDDPLLRNVRARNNPPVRAPQPSSTPTPWKLPEQELLDPQLPTPARVANNPNRVVSPYDPTKQVDITGMSPGEVVLDPFAQRPFIIPPMP
jgi:hypothetical protein